MCGRFTLRTPMAVLAEQFRLTVVEPIAPRYNIAPTQQVAAVRTAAETVDRELAHLRWGLIPSWARDRVIGNRMINARAETVAEKPSFRSAFRRRRCLVLADGYYEWRKVGRAKQPYYFHMTGDGPFAFAGLWERWEKGDEPIESCTIITTAANRLAREVHDRMPVILSPADCDLWLDRSAQTAELAGLLRPYDAGQLTSHEVATLVNSPKNDDPKCVEPIA